MLKDPVRCRADHAYPGRPLEVWQNGRWQAVTAVLEEKLTPAGRFYRVICEESNVFDLLYDPDHDNWQVKPADVDGTIQTQENK